MRTWWFIELPSQQITERLDGKWVGNTNLQSRWFREISFSWNFQGSFRRRVGILKPLSWKTRLYYLFIWSKLFSSLSVYPSKHWPHGLWLCWRAFWSPFQITGNALIISYTMHKVNLVDCSDLRKSLGSHIILQFELYLNFNS